METLLETEAAGSSGPRRSSDPERIGPYRVLERLGSGGMGAVFLAEQVEPVRRKVAVKIMRSTFLDPEAKIRFESERQAMARLQHPNVGQIFAADATEEGHPYFVMEHVPGRQIVRYCDEKRLSLEERLLLFCDVCAGVQHAHQKGLIHRDLKPTNILVTEIEGRPVPKIIDFGIAKAVDEPLSQEALITGDRLIGTPAYLSPEAARLGDGSMDLDTRSDVFSLGILLYELLVGHRPFDDESTNMLQVLRRIADEEPKGPSARWSRLDVTVREVVAQQRHLDVATLHRTLRGDLDWIVLKAIAKDREKRYGSAADLATDIRRYLRHEPVSASPPSPLYRARKFVRRRLGTVVSVMVVVLALVGGFAARTLEADRANREREAAVAARMETEAALEQAEQSRAEAAQVSEFLLELFEVSDPGEARGSSITARELLDNGAEKIRDELRDQPLTRARLMHTMSQVYRKLGLFQDAESLIDEALSLRRAHLPAQHLDLSESLNAKAAVLAEAGEPASALPLVRESLAIRESVYGPDSYKVALNLSNLGNIYTELGRLDEAEPVLLRAVRIVEGYDELPDPSLLAAFNNLGSLYMDQERYAEAEPQLRTFLGHLSAVHGDDHPWTAFGLENLGEVQWKLGRVEEAHRSYGEALVLLEKIFGADHVEVGFCLGKMAQIHAEQGDVEQAEALFRRALAIHEASLPEDHAYRVEVAEGLATLQRARPAT